MNEITRIVKSNTAGASNVEIETGRVTQALVAKVIGNFENAEQGLTDFTVIAFNSYRELLNGPDKDFFRAQMESIPKDTRCDADDFLHRFQRTLFSSPEVTIRAITPGMKRDLRAAGQTVLMALRYLDHVTYTDQSEVPSVKQIHGRLFSLKDSVGRGKPLTADSMKRLFCGLVSTKNNALLKAEEEKRYQIATDSRKAKMAALKITDEAEYDEHVKKESDKMARKDAESSYQQKIESLKVSDIALDEGIYSCHNGKVVHIAFASIVKHEAALSAVLAQTN